MTRRPYCLTEALSGILPRTPSGALDPQYFIPGPAKHHIAPQREAYSYKAL